MGLPLGSLASGLTQGFENGIGMADKLRMLHDAARVRAAKAALGNVYGSDAPLPDGSTPPVTPPSPGQASTPANATLAAVGASSGAPPPPDAMPPTPAPMPPAAPTPAPAPPPNMPATAAAPATGSDGTPLSGVAASTAAPGGQPDQAVVTSSIQDANNTIKAIAAAVKQSNPNIDPETLFEAVSQHISTMKGVRDEVKDYMEAQVRLAAQQNKVLTTGMNIAGRQGVADTRAQAQVTTGAGHDTARVTAAGLSADAREAAAQIAAQGGITRAQIAADTGRYVADANNKTRVYDTQLQQFVKIASGNSADEAKVDAATANAGGTPPARKRLNPLPMPAAPGGVAAPAPAPAPAAAAGRQYRNLAALQAAFKAGKVDMATAKRIALANGWGS